MAIKIRKKVEEEKPTEVLEPEVLPPEGEEEERPVNDVKVPGLDDEFLKKSGTMMNWLIEHGRAVLGVSGVIVIAAFAVLGVNRMNERGIEKDSSTLTAAFETYTAVTQDQEAQDVKAQETQIQEEGLTGDLSEVRHRSYTVKDDRSRFLMISKYLNDSLPKLGDKQIGTSGLLMQAGSTARVQGLAAAEPLYKKASGSVDKNVALFGKLGEIDALADAGKIQEAIALVDGIAADNDFAQLNSYLMYEKARLLELSGDTAQAIELYTQVLGMNHRIDVELSLARLRVLTPDWSERYRKAQLGQDPAAQNVQSQDL